MKIIEVPGDKAMQELFRLLSSKAVTGLHPVWFGGNSDIAYIAKQHSQVKNPGSVMTKSRKVKIKNMIADFYSPASGDGEPRPEEAAEDAWVLDEGQKTTEEPEGDTDEDSCGEGFEDVALDLHCGKNPPKTVHIGLLDIAEPWQMFANLGGSGSDFNCALFRRWQEEWGAEVIVLQEGIIECRVMRPPQTREDAMRLAREQYYYCDDIVHQGTGSVLEFADTLLGRDTWFFWWD